MQKKNARFFGRFLGFFLFENFQKLRHILFAEHLTAEYRVKTEGRGRRVDEWKMRPEAHDNHWFDGLVGCAVAASMSGCVLEGTDKNTKNVKPKVKMKLSEIQKIKKV